MKSKVWLHRKDNDLFIKQAKDRGYLSRAAFKLLEIENKYKFIVNSTTVLELGSSPGSWTQIIFEKNPKIKLYAFDLLDMKYDHKNLHFIKEDFLNYNYKKIQNKFDLILCDIAPNTTGHKSTDHLKIASIIEEIIDILSKISLPKSNFVFKIWKGSQEKNIINKVKKIYNKISYFKPRSSRKESSEIFIVAEKFIS